MDLRIFDHVVIGENAYFSFADEGLLEEFEQNECQIYRCIIVLPLSIHYKTWLFGYVTCENWWMLDTFLLKYRQYLSSDAGNGFIHKTFALLR